jgi:hypothetical protein
MSPHGAFGARAAETATRRDFFAGVAAAAIAATTSSESSADTIGNADDVVVELRQYTLRKGQRDTLIALFEEKFVAPQNDLGARIIGTFRDLDDPDRFVWLRGFRDMAVRKRSLEAFYGGPVWRDHRGAANATMVDSDNVLLLRPAGEGQGLAASSEPPGTTHVIGARIHYLDTVDPERFASFFERSVRPRLADMGVRPIARFITEGAANNFRLPIREHERVYVWFARWNSLRDEEDFSARWSALSGWRDDAPEAILAGLMRKPERLRLAPTASSALR